MSYIDDLAGHLNVLTPEQVKALHGQISPLGDPMQAPKSPGGLLDPGNLQPAELLAGSTGEPILESPSGSGTGLPVFSPDRAAGTRGVE